ncbi:PDDEXK nuclease domain-containing protein [Dinghuibacter silviterrae]|uniref:PDDEXK nuclease domain-containing protein n=1 Tax=Dinghuibacter silviterrae TaxID=1539049 RepID=UPI001B86406E|nr:PDDEXK nuclease domain-containing protein [Dinghuibacter silviterrae]
MSLGSDPSERDVEKGLLAHLQKFMLELGQGFAFMGSQYHLEVDDEDFYMDMLFYHTRLRCYCVLEIKTTPFKPEYVGKLNFYLNVVNAQLRQDGDQPSIGILLCKTPNKVTVEYALQNITGPMGVTEYQIMASLPDSIKYSLPSKEDLEEQLT